MNKTESTESITYEPPLRDQSKSQRAMKAARQLNLQYQHARDQKSALTEHSQKGIFPTVADVAAMMHVTPDAIERARQVLDAAAPSVIEQVDEGTLTTTQALATLFKPGAYLAADGTNPRWMRVSDEVMERDKFACVHCGDKEGPFAIRHAYVIKGREACEYPMWSLSTRCADCDATNATSQMDEMSATLTWEDDIDELLGGNEPGENGLQISAKRAVRCGTSEPPNTGAPVSATQPQLKPPNKKAKPV